MTNARGFRDNSTHVFITTVLTILKTKQVVCDFDSNADNGVQNFIWRKSQHFGQVLLSRKRVTTFKLSDVARVCTRRRGGARAYRIAAFSSAALVDTGCFARVMRLVKNNANLTGRRRALFGRTVFGLFDAAFFYVAFLRVLGLSVSLIRRSTFASLFFISKNFTFFKNGTPARLSVSSRSYAARGLRAQTRFLVRNNWILL